MSTIRHFGPVTAVIDEIRKVIELRLAPPSRDPLPDKTKKRAVAWARGRLAEEFPAFTIDDREATKALGG